ncbi:hypothetical protein BCY89_13735 [Sphingobacterium siyangense]|uniref:Uncharacterized protein n=1 Tax=Sphingobacterium siyangense TaxID=459529 RepID=A0A420FH48_9SPHI|nr:hypothetical protein BCY89_13735 [Sphingobacterium siyangense]
MRDSFWFPTTDLRRRWQKGCFPKIYSGFQSLLPVRASAQDTGRGWLAQESTKVGREWQRSRWTGTGAKIAGKRIEKHQGA